MTNRKDKIFKIAKGYYKKAKNCYRTALNRVEKGLQHAYKGRKVKKRDWRSQWIKNINAATNDVGVKYSQFMYGLTLSKSALNRKVLAEIAKTEPLSMRTLIALSTNSRKALAQQIRPLKEKHAFPFYEPPIGSSLDEEQAWLNSNRKKVFDTLQEILSEALVREKQEDEIYDKKLEAELKKLGKKPELIPGE
jgi:large subunit ribosomal protein L20